VPAYDRNNIFARILRGEAPCTKVYEDEFALAFQNIHPQTPVHVLVVPKGEYVSIADFSALAPAELVLGFWRAVRRVANHGPDANQIIFHFHVHILGGRRLNRVSGVTSGVSSET